MTVSTAARIATFGSLDTERNGQVDRVLADVDLVLQRRRDVDRRVGDDQHLVIGRHVHDEHVADAAAGAQAGLPAPRPRRAARRCAGCLSSAARPAPGAPAPRPWLPQRGCGGVDDAGVPEIDPSSSGRPPSILPAGPTRMGVISPFAPASTAPASADSSQGCATAVGTGSRGRHRSSSCSYLPVPGCPVMVPRGPSRFHTRTTRRRSITAGDSTALAGRAGA